VGIEPTQRPSRDATSVLKTGPDTSLDPPPFRAVNPIRGGTATARCRAAGLPGPGSASCERPPAPSLGGDESFPSGCRCLSRSRPSGRRSERRGIDRARRAAERGSAIRVGEGRNDVALTGLGGPLPGNTRRTVKGRTPRGPAFAANVVSLRPPACRRGGGGDATSSPHRPRAAVGREQGSERPSRVLPRRRREVSRLGPPPQVQRAA